MLEEDLSQQRQRAGKNVSKRRRMTGSLEEDLPPLAHAPAGLEERPVEPEALVDRTEILDAPTADLPAPHLNAAPSAEPASRNSPPEAIPIGDASIAQPQGPPLTPLEMRIRRLEDALAQLQIRRAAEQGVTARPGTPSIPVATPASTPPHQAPTDKLWEFGKKVLAAPGEVARNLSQAPGSPRTRRAWLLFESLAELRAILRMFTDPRYRLSWTMRIAPLAIVVAICFSWSWVPFTMVPVFGGVLNKAFDVALAFILFKMLTHEARRYRETAPDLPPSLRL
jgi:hypothetical protein